MNAVRSLTPAVEANASTMKVVLLVNATMDMRQPALTDLVKVQNFNALQIINSIQDIDECATGAHQCAYRCKNETPQNGKYSCLCPSGYELKPDGRHCKDINECAQ